MRDFSPNKNTIKVLKDMKPLMVKLRRQIIVLTIIFEMRRQTTKSVNNFLRSIIAKTKQTQCWETPFKDAE